MPKSASASSEALAAIQKAAALAAAVAERNAMNGDEEGNQPGQGTSLDKKLAEAKAKSRWDTVV